MQKLDCALLGKMCEFLLDGEPCYVIRAQDALTTGTLQDYLDRANQAGARNTIRTADHMKRVADWQRDNPGRVKVPD